MVQMVCHMLREVKGTPERCSAHCCFSSCPVAPCLGLQDKNRRNQCLVRDCSFEAVQLVLAIQSWCAGCPRASRRQKSSNCWAPILIYTCCQMLTAVRRRPGHPSTGVFWTSSEALLLSEVSSQPCPAKVAQRRALNTCRTLRRTKQNCAILRLHSSDVPDGEPKRNPTACAGYETEMVASGALV